ncbi:acetolactate synthase [Thermanaerothrix daxensis]|uniref:Acetolactate synthase small subunit n=1 Tax=Thermanaerothrix daxensis TaxID=869279 RepID=A0A0P6XVK1_9CHLR|nr:acetolactate synthase small subunit [Thermanaerothrix daxensis]KPL83167.1 acetolactate synthase [Thermanaerothrix daxensis]
MQHIIVALVEDKPGVLNRVASLFRRRNFNIESLTVGHTEQPGISRMTIVVDSDNVNAERLTAYLYKLINVIQVSDLTSVPKVTRDLALIKVRATPENRGHVMQIVEVFRAHVVDVATDSMIVEITGDEEKIEGFLEVLRPIGIIEMVRTGVVSMARGNMPLYANGNGYHTALAYSE